MNKLVRLIQNLNIDNTRIPTQKDSTNGSLGVVVQKIPMRADIMENPISPNFLYFMLY
jgi:hypothetical protein